MGTGRMAAMDSGRADRPARVPWIAVAVFAVALALWGRFSREPELAPSSGSRPRGV